MAYTDQTEFGWTNNSAPRIASNSGTGWTFETLSDTRSNGWYTDIAIDSAGNRIVSFTNSSGIYNHLMVARDQTGSWVEESVTANGTFASVAYVNDVAHVAYYSSNPQMIRLAVDNGSGWDIHNVTTDGVVNTYRLDIDVTTDDKLLIAYHRGTDQASDDLCDAPQECTIQVAYAIGVAKPLSVYIDTNGAGEVDEVRLSAVLQELVDLTPRGIREHLALNKPIYARTAAYGHFGREPEPDGGFSWERTDLIDDLNSAFEAG